MPRPPFLCVYHGTARKKAAYWYPLRRKHRRPAGRKIRTENEMKEKTGKKLYSVPEIYGIAVKAFRSAGDLRRAKKSGVLTEALQERVMLAVTSVNQCAMCSYAHTGMALKAGLSDREIQSFVTGEFPAVPAREGKAVLFGQYYAETRGRPEKAVWDELVLTYGPDAAAGILAAARMIMMGNAMGIVFGSVSGRLHGRGGDERSSVPYELAVIVSLLPVMLLAAGHASISALLGQPKLHFTENRTDV